MVKKTWKRIEEYRELQKQINGINQRIQQLKNTAYTESSEIIDLASGLPVVNIEAEMKKEFCREKIKQLRKKRSELIAKQRDVEADLQKDYKDLKRVYQRGLIKLDLFFKRFLKQLKDLRMTWNLATEESNDLANVSRTIWQLRGILGINEVLKEMPPFHKWKDEMRKIFTILKNFEEVEKHG